MYANLAQTLTTFLKVPITLIGRGEPLPLSLVHQVPVAWATLMDVAHPLEEGIVQYWNVGAAAQPFLEHLVRDCKEVAIVLRQETVIGLLYLLKVRRHGKTVEVAWLGGFPATTNDIVIREKELGEILPFSYRNFVKIHNGFWLQGWNMCGLYALTKIGFLSDVLPESTAVFVRPATFSPSELLCFGGDGSGNEVCFHYSLATKQKVPNLVMWDHESYTISPPVPFWDYMSRLLEWVG